MQNGELSIEKNVKCPADVYNRSDDGRSLVTSRGSELSDCSGTYKGIMYYNVLEMFEERGASGLTV